MMFEDCNNICSTTSFRQALCLLPQVFQILLLVLAVYGAYIIIQKFMPK